MDWKKWMHPGAVIFLVAFLTAVTSTFVLLALNQVGLLAFTGGGWLVAFFTRVGDYLGTSVLFFVPVFMGYCYFFLKLKISLGESEQEKKFENIAFYGGGMDVCTTLFFAIGVLFTAWGMQNALVSAIGNVTQEEAARLGAWGILKRLVDQGILIALWTTIVGGAGGYLMRLVKYISFGRAMNRMAIREGVREKEGLFQALESIRAQMESMELHFLRLMAENENAVEPD